MNIFNPAPYIREGFTDTEIEQIRSSLDEYERTGISYTEAEVDRRITQKRTQYQQYA